MVSANRVEKDRLAVDAALLVARLALAVIFIAHGAQKLFGVFGGPGFGTIIKMMGTLGYFVTVAELGGGLGLLVGFLSRFSAFWLAAEMVGAIITVHGKNGFFLAPKLGFEYNLALIGLLLVILIAGPGRFSVSRALPFLRHPVIE